MCTYFCCIVCSSMATTSSSVTSSFGGRIPFFRKISFHSVSAFGSCNAQTLVINYMASYEMSPLHVNVQPVRTLLGMTNPWNLTNSATMIFQFGGYITLDWNFRSINFKLNNTLRHHSKSIYWQSELLIYCNYHTSYMVPTETSCVNAFCIELRLG